MRRSTLSAKYAVRAIATTPIHAPPTASERPSTPDSHGSRKIDGSANAITSDAAYASCSFFACTAPAAAIAALTPQIDTADASSARSLSSRPSRPPSHQVKPKTMLINKRAWMMAGPAAVTSTFKLIDAPSNTRPVLMKNSVRKPFDSASRKAIFVSTALPIKPKAIA